jgi:hypothetical protein
MCSYVGYARSERFIEEPEDATVIKGELHTFRCVTEDRIGQVQWLRGGFGLGPGNEFEGFPRYRVQQSDERGKERSVTQV